MPYIMMRIIILGIGKAHSSATRQYNLIIFNSNNIHKPVTKIMYIATFVVKFNTVLTLSKFKGIPNSKGT